MDSTEQRPFRLEASFEPAGDQPQAIDKLVEGLGEGLAHQTLLGVTGSGKSVGYDDPILVAEVATAGETRTRLVKAGPFIDALMATRSLPPSDAPDTESYFSAGASYLTPAFNPLSGETAWHPVAALLRHRAPSQMFRVSTQCGRSVNATPDHNFWVLREGELRLVRTQDVRPSDFLPAPDILTGLPHEIHQLDILPYLADAKLFVHAEEPVCEYLAAAGGAQFASTLAECGINPHGKLYAL
ncbi:MAG TPA: hypothetical protein VLX90_00470, partial [Steroidobacteraceae bacterium]|nr:hypothetical protein [Steroidobacteraceae bacterium]